MLSTILSIIASKQVNELAVVDNIAVYQFKSLTGVCPKAFILSSEPTWNSEDYKSNFKALSGFLFNEYTQYADKHRKDFFSSEGMALRDLPLSLLHRALVSISITKNDNLYGDYHITDSFEQLTGADFKTFVADLESSWDGMTERNRFEEMASYLNCFYQNLADEIYGSQS